MDQAAAELQDFYIRLAMVLAIPILNLLTFLCLQKIKAGDELHVKLKVTNTGKVKGDEVVQLYLSDLVSSVTTYEMDLRGFERVTLEPGKQKKCNLPSTKNICNCLMIRWNG